MVVMEDKHSTEMSTFASTGVMGLAAATVTNLALGHCIVHFTWTTSQITIDTIRSFMEALMVRVL
jgi:hypothetical protein